MTKLKDNNQNAKFSECHMKFVIKSKSAMMADGEFFIVMTPEEAIEFLKEIIKKRELEKGTK